MHNNKSNGLLHRKQLAFLGLLIVALFFTTSPALAATTQCTPDNVMISGFENELPLLFEDTFEGCRSPLWREVSGDWQVTDG